MVKKRSLNQLYMEIQTLKDLHDKEMNSLKKIIKQQDERIKDIEKVAASYGHRIIDIQKKPEIPTSGVNSNTDIWMRKKNDINLLKCEMCVDSFTKFCDLEFHIKKKHETYKEQECDHCGKSFVTTWRLRKHMRIHSQFTNNCRYFQAGMVCPFEELGCKFLHSLPEKLTLGSSDSNNIKNLDSDSIMPENVFQIKSSFATSMPNKKRFKFACTCKESFQCEECFVDEYIDNRKNSLMHDKMTLDV